MSAIASASVGNTRARSSTCPAAPEAMATARGLGQPSRGSTSRMSVRPKFSIARAAAATPATIATASPAPSTEPTTPTTAASVSTDARTWAVVEPMVRSSARSRVRWATSTWKVFAMTSAVTSRASAAKPPS